MSHRRRVWVGMFVLLATGCLPLAASGNSQVRWRSGISRAPDRNSSEVASRIARTAQLAPATGNRHLIVQFRGPLQQSDRDHCADAGLRMLAYLGDNAYFASLSGSGVDRQLLARIGSLVDARAINRRWKLHPYLASGRKPGWAEVGTDDTGGPVIGAYVLFHADVALDLVGRDLVRRHGGVVRAALRSINGLVIELPQSRVGELADEDAVQYIEPALPKMSARNDSNRQLVGADLVQAPPFGLDGSGVTAMLYDSGRAASTNGAVHPDLGARITLMDTSPFSSHATHVACTLAGNDSQLGGLHSGMAPAATLLSYGFESDGTGTFLYTNPGDLESDYSDAINARGADIANNSIGTNTCSNGFPCEITGDYGVTSALIDAIVRGSLGAPFLVVWANGNERACSACPAEHVNGYHSTAPPAGAKNQIAVGAVNSNDDSMTAFSSWGPTDDGRLKPDLVAPGCQTDADLGVTSCNSAFGTFGYTVLCGTSMAAPTVTGLSALLLQDFRTQFPAQPRFRNSTLKVLLAQNAVDIGNVGPDYQSGYGSVRIQPTIDFMRSGAFLEDEVSHAGTFSIAATVAPGVSEFKVTLAWDDAPGTPNVALALVNDLDLRVVDPSGTPHFPWTLDPVNPATPAVRNQADHLNNIEQVVIDGPAPGTYLIEVLGTNVPSPPQPFSLAAPGISVFHGQQISLTPTATTAPFGAQQTLDAVVVAGSPPFGPISGATVTFDVLSGPNTGQNATGTTDIDGITSFSYSGEAGAGSDQVSASFVDGTGLHVSNPAIVEWVPGTISLAPTTATMTECGMHTVLASTSQGAFPFAPLAGVLTTFAVISGPNTGAGAAVISDGTGSASFSYAGQGGAGTDTIQASFADALQTQVSNPVTATWLASTADCNLNGLPDQCEVGWDQDCNGNGGADLCDLVAAVGFDAPFANAVDANPAAIAVGDLDGIAGVDFVTASSANKTVSVVLNAGGGSFAPGVDYLIDKGSSALTLADLDGDGDLDVAAATQKDTLSILLGNGDGSFVPGGNVPTLGSRPTSVASADVDGIAGPDLIVTHRDQNAAGAFTVTVLLNNGNATFQGAVSYEVGDTPQAVLALDLDGVNGPDLVVANKQIDTIAILLNNGDGTFAPAVHYAAGNGPLSIAAADFDGDGDTDLAVVDAGSNSIRILLNNGVGVYSFTANLLVSTGPTSIVAVDLEGDGDPDLAVSIAGSLGLPTGTVSILVNRGDATFLPQVQLSAGALSPVAITAADFDGNGDPDLATAHNLGTGLALVSLGRVVRSSVDSNLNFVPDECDAALGGNGWIFAGVAEGGLVDVAVEGVHVVVGTTTGESAAAIALSLAAAINADPSLLAAGIGALVVDSTVTTNGAISSTTVSDPGISYSPAGGIPIPVLPPLGLALLVAVFLLVTLRVLAQPTHWAAGSPRAPTGQIKRYDDNAP